MDIRQTFENTTQVKAFVLSAVKEKASVSLLVDRNGIFRLQGLITAVHQAPDINQAMLTINDQEVLLKDIVAINGVFRSDYSEC